MIYFILRAYTGAGVSHSYTPLLRPLCVKPCPSYFYVLNESLTENQLSLRTQFLDFKGGLKEGSRCALKQRLRRVALGVYLMRSKHQTTALKAKTYRLKTRHNNADVRHFFFFQQPKQVRVAGPIAGRDRRTTIVISPTAFFLLDRRRTDCDCRDERLVTDDHGDD